MLIKAPKSADKLDSYLQKRGLKCLIFTLCNHEKNDLKAKQRSVWLLRTTKRSFWLNLAALWKKGSTLRSLPSTAASATSEWMLCQTPRLIVFQPILLSFGKSISLISMRTYTRPHATKNKISFTAVSRIIQLDIGLQNLWTFEEREALAARAFKVWKFLRNKVVFTLERISYLLHFSLLYVVYR